MAIPRGNPIIYCASPCTWHVNGGSFAEDELVRAQELVKAGAERVWQAMKDSVRSMNA